MDNHDRYFRGWHSTLKIMYDEIGITSTGQPFIDYDSDGITYFGKEVILMMNTGYSDCDGLEIFEGDIVKLNKHKAIIRWGDACFYFEPLDDGWLDDWNFCDDASRTKIIGNVHQNPEIQNPELFE